MLLSLCFIFNMSEEWKWSESEVSESYPTLCDPTDSSLPCFSVHGIFRGKSTGMGCHFLLRGIFPTQGSNPGLPHCRQMLLLSEPPRKLSSFSLAFTLRQKVPQIQTSLLALAYLVFLSRPLKGTMPGSALLLRHTAEWTMHILGDSTEEVLGISVYFTYLFFRMW